MNKDRNYLLKKLYQALWFSADFELDLAANFPDKFKKLRENENSLSTEEIFSMFVYMNQHPVFN